MVLCNPVVFPFSSLQEKVLQGAAQAHPDSSRNSFESTNKWAQEQAEAVGMVAEDDETGDFESKRSGRKSMRELGLPPPNYAGSPNFLSVSPAVSISASPRGSFSDSAGGNEYMLPVRSGPSRRGSNLAV